MDVSTAARAKRSPLSLLSPPHAQIPPTPVAEAEGAEMGSALSPEAEKPRGHLGAKALLEGSVDALRTWRGHPRGHGTCPGWGLGS